MALLDADVVRHVVLAGGVVPEVVPVLGRREMVGNVRLPRDLLEDGVPVLHVGHAVLTAVRKGYNQIQSKCFLCSLEVVGLMLAPVKPLDAAVEVGVPPVPVHMVAVVVLGARGQQGESQEHLGHGAHPEEVTPGDPRPGQGLRLPYQPSNLLSRVPSRRVLVNQHRLDENIRQIY